MSEFMRILMATGEAKSVAEHKALRDDLCAHGFARRGELLEPYVDGVLLVRVVSAFVA